MNFIITDTFYCKFVKPLATIASGLYDDGLKRFHDLDDVIQFMNENLISFWLLVKSIKEDAIYLCRNNGPKAYIGQTPIGGEGYVYSNEFGTFKLVNREQFSYSNFNNNKFQSVDK